MSFVPSTILVLLGYWLSSVYGVLQTLTPYLALRRPFGSRTLRSSNHSSVLLTPFHAILRFGSVALAASSIIALLFPAVRILAAGLYITMGSVRLRPVQVTVYTSMTDRFEAMYEEFPSVDSSTAQGVQVTSMVKQAMEFAEWTSIPDFGVLQRAGTLGHLVFGNLTQLGSEDGIQHSVGDIISLRIPAIAVNVTCQSLGPEHFSTCVKDESTSGTNFTVFDFTMKCKTALCNNTFNVFNDNDFSYEQSMWQKTSDEAQGSTSSSAPRRYQGTASVAGYTKLGNLTQFDTPYLLTLGDFLNIHEPFVNQTKLSTNSTELVPWMFNTTVSPQQIAATCNKAFWEVDVDVEVTTRSVKSGVGSTTSYRGVFRDSIAGLLSTKDSIKMPLPLGIPEAVCSKPI
jgi:Protein of unknown function (DUF3433)